MKQLDLAGEAFTVEDSTKDGGRQATIHETSLPASQTALPDWGFRTL